MHRAWHNQGNYWNARGTERIVRKLQKQTSVAPRVAHRRHFTLISRSIKRPWLFPVFVPVAVTYASRVRKNLCPPGATTGSFGRKYRTHRVKYDCAPANVRRMGRMETRNRGISESWDCKGSNEGTGKRERRRKREKCMELHLHTFSPSRLCLTRISRMALARLLFTSSSGRWITQWTRTYIKRIYKSESARRDNSR